MMRKRAPLLAAFAAVGLVCWVTVAAAEPPTTSVSTDTVVPGTTHSSTFTDANGDMVRKTEVDFTWASIVNAFVGSGHATIFRITHASTGISDTTGVDSCTTCTDTAGSSGAIHGHLLGATGSVTHRTAGNGTAGLASDRGSYSRASVAGVTTDTGVLAKSPCISGHHAGPLVVASGDSECLAEDAHQSGPVTVQPGAHFFSNGAFISGGVTASSPGAISICDTRIAGRLSISGSTGPVLVGEPATGDCPGNRISGEVAITGDLAGTDFSGNTVSGSATLTGNVGGFVFGDLAANKIAGAVVTGGNV
jgi:hypothetical protein